MTPIVKYKKLDSRAVVPTYATPGAAAADLCAVLDEPLTLAPMQRTLVPTGLAIELPGPECVALVYARSGLSIKHGLCMANGVGVIDSDYRGELRVPMVNLSNEPYTIQPGGPALHCPGLAGGLHLCRRADRHPARCRRLWVDRKIIIFHPHFATLRHPTPTIINQKGSTPWL